MKNYQETWVLNAQTRNADRPSLTKRCHCGSAELYQRCHGTAAGSGPLFKKDIAFCLSAGGPGQYVLVSPRSTKSPRKSTNGTSRGTGRLETSPSSMPRSSPTSTLSAEGFLVRLSRWLAGGRVSETREA